MGTDHLNPRPVGRSALPFPAPPPEHEVTPLRSLTRQLLHQPGLPDARLPDDEQEASAARDGVFQTRAQLHELVVSTDEDRRHRRDHSALAASRQGPNVPATDTPRMPRAPRAATVIGRLSERTGGAARLGTPPNGRPA